jgi:hypothetical protein
MQAKVQQLSESATEKLQATTNRKLKNLTLVVDLGNGNAKGITKQHGLVVVPSLSKECNAGFTKGNVVLSNGFSYCFGNLELSQGVPTAQDTSNKVENVKQLLLGFLANLELKAYFLKDLSVDVYLLSHAYFDYKDDLKNLLTFTETVKLSGSDFRLVVTCKKVFPEAYGGQFIERKSKKPLLLIDFGSGTTQIIDFTSKDVEPHIESVGVHHLIKEICNRGTKLNYGYPLDYHLVNRALKKSEQKTASGVDFSSIYRDCLKFWMKQYLAETVKVIKSSDDYDVYAVGGGCLLPDMKELLSLHNVKVVPDPLTASVRNTYQHLLNKGCV